MEILSRLGLGSGLGFPYQHRVDVNSEEVDKNPNPNPNPNSEAGDEKYGNSPLHWSCWHGNVENLRLLLKSGADPYKLNRAKEMPLDTY